MENSIVPQPTPQCPICDRPLDERNVKFDLLTRTYQVLCSNCGPFELTEQAKFSLDEDITDEKQYALSWIVRGLPETQKRPIKSSDLDDLVRQGLNRERSLLGKARLLLEELRKRSSKRFGTEADFDWDCEWPLVRTRGPEECFAIITQLEHRNRLKIITHDRNKRIRLEWEGWEQTEPLRGNATGTVFVAMAFHADMDNAYEAGIRTAIDNCDLTPIRIDKETFSDKSVSVC